MKRTTVKESFKTYKGPLTQKEYNQIQEEFNLLLFDTLFITGDSFELPAKLGTLEIQKYKPSKPLIDFNATKKYGKKIYHTNRHTRGYAFKIVWKKRKATFKRKFSWDLKLVRSLKRTRLQFLITKYGFSHIHESKYESN